MEQPVVAWVPNDRFRAEATRFAEYRETERYREEEFDYKAGFSALLKALTSPAELREHGTAGLEGLAAGHPDLDAIALSQAERALLAKWPPYQTLLNLLGSAQAAVIQASAFRRWAADDSLGVATAVENLLRGAETLAARFDAFIDVAQSAYQRLFERGELRSREVPHVSPQLAAVFLCLTEPDRYGLLRPTIYQTSADAFEYPLSLQGSVGEHYTAATAMLAAFRDALRAEGCAVEDLLEVHNLLWIRARDPGWSGMGTDRWAAGDFDAMRTDNPQDPTKTGIIDGKLRRVGDGLRAGLHRRTGHEFSATILGRYPPSRRSWPWLNVSLGEPRFGSQPKARPQLNVEIGADGLDVFFFLDLRATAAGSVGVRERVRARRGDPALIGPALEFGVRGGPGR